MPKALGSLFEKLRQTAAFLRHTNTPLRLAADSFQLLNRPFVAVHRSGIRLRLRPACGESFTFYEILVRNDYLQHGIRLEPGDTVVDIGANIGAFTVLAAHAVGSEGRVLSFEPEPESCRLMRENVGLNGLQNVTVSQAAVSGGDGEARLLCTGKSAFSSLIEQVGDRSMRDGNALTVQMRGINELLDQLGPAPVDLLKIDCEGAEYEILDALKPRFAAHVRQIAMEVHPIPGRKVPELARRLEALGFECHHRYPFVAFNRRGAHRASADANATV